MVHRSVATLELHLVGYRRTWRATALGSFVLPLLTVVGFGLGVGEYVDGGIEGVAYLDWLVPGLIAATALQVAIFEGTFPVMSRFLWMKTYYALAASPLRVVDIVAGHAMFTLFRVLLTTGAFMLVAAAFGTLHAASALAVFPIAALLGLAVSMPTAAYGATVSTDSQLVLLFRFGLLPMTLFAGVYFPVESLPEGLRWLAYASPLWHGVDLCRAATLGVPPVWSPVGHVLYLAVWAGAGWLLAVARFRRRLIV